MLKLRQANLLDNSRKINLLPVANCDNVLPSGNADLSAIKRTYRVAVEIFQKGNRRYMFH